MERGPGGEVEILERYLEGEIKTWQSGPGGEVDILERYSDGGPYQANFIGKQYNHFQESHWTKNVNAWITTQEFAKNTGLTWQFTRETITNETIYKKVLIDYYVSFDRTSADYKLYIFKVQSDHVFPIRHWRRGISFQ